MAKNTSEGTRVYIGPATVLEDETDLAGLSYVEIGGVGSVGEIGPSSQDVPFSLLKGGTLHFKGGADNGAVTFNVARDPLDAGQIALKAAALTKLEYALKIVVPDAADGNDTDTVFYVRGPVMAGRTNIGDQNTVTQTSFSVGANVFIEVASEAVSGS